MSGLLITSSVEYMKYTTQVEYAENYFIIKCVDIPRLSQTKVTFHKVINVLHKKKKTNFGILDGKLDFHQIEPNIYSSALLFNWGTLGVIIVTSNAALANIVSLNQRK